LIEPGLGNILLRFSISGKKVPSTSFESTRERPAMRDKREPVLVKCPKCRRTQIVYIPEEKIPRCSECHVEMIIEELLDEGKSF
jgi:ribosomal protein S27E